MNIDIGEIDKIRNDFPILKREIHGHPLVYLDNAATTLKPKSVINAISRHYGWESANIHRGGYYLSEQATEDYEQVRKQVKRLINAHNEHQIVFTSGTTDAINLVAKSYGSTMIKENDEIIISQMEHHANIVPWHLLKDKVGCKIKVLPLNEDGTLNIESLPDLITPKTKLIAVVHISNSLGIINPVSDIVKIARQHQVPVLIDGAQAIANQKVDVTQLDCDFYVFSAHKMFGPTGVGVLYAKEEILEKMPPVQGGGGGIVQEVTMEKTTFQYAPHKFEPGTPNIGGVIGFGAAIDYLSRWKTYIGYWEMDLLPRYKESLMQHASERLLEIPGLKIIGSNQPKAPIISFVMKNIHPHDIGTILDRNGIAVRTGHHCNQPLMDFFGIPATTRVSFATYNSKEDVDRLIQGMKKVRELF